MTATTKVDLGICESCEGIADVEDDKCHGCCRMICAFCAIMFDHASPGDHGRGDPTEAMLSLREAERCLRVDYNKYVLACKQFKKRAQAAEMKYDALKEQALAAQETIRAFCNYVAIAKPIEGGN